MDRRWALALTLAGLLATPALRVAAVHTTAFNWDELALLSDAARSAEEGVLVLALADPPGPAPLSFYQGY